MGTADNWNETVVIWSGRPANQATVMSREEGATVPLTSAISPDGSADGRRQRKLGVCTYLHRLRSMLGAKVGTRSVRCRNNSLSPVSLHDCPAAVRSHTHRAPRHTGTRALNITQSSITAQHSNQRASPPPRCTRAHVTQSVSSLQSPRLHGHPHPDLSAVLPPCRSMHRFLGKS